MPKGKADMPFCTANVCFWPKADIASCSAHVGKADMCLCAAQIWLDLGPTRFSHSPRKNFIGAISVIVSRLLAVHVMGVKEDVTMNKRIDSLRFLTAVLTLGMLANAGGTSALAADRNNTIGSARSSAVHDCNIHANKFSPITQLPDQFAVYGTCMTNHGQKFG